jgi:phosphate starvation-inducible PhoH-like protein
LKEDPSYILEFRDNHLLSVLVGPEDRFFNQIEKRLGITLALRGNKVHISGPEPEVTHASRALEYLYKYASKNESIDMADVDTAIRLVTTNTDTTDTEAPHQGVSIITKKRIIFPRSNIQAEYIQALKNYDMTFGIGPAGTGKTYLAVAVGVSMLLSGMVDKIILTRPAVEAGERLGFLPGDMKEKIDPYLRPLYDALHDMLPPEQVVKRISIGEIEIAPLAFMRGRTLSNAFVILDEAQNTTTMQMKMFLTRLGPGSKMIVTGDLTQVDLPYGVESGLRNAMNILRKVKDISFITFSEKDVVRHNLVSKIVHAYEHQKKND